MPRYELSTVYFEQDAARIIFEVNWGLEIAARGLSMKVRFTDVPSLPKRWDEIFADDNQS